MARRLTPLLALALAAASFAAYLPVLDNGFVNYDDDHYIVENPHVSEGLSRENVRWAFTSFHLANWFPLTWLSWMLDVELFGLEPRGFHATSLLLHCANAVLLFLAFTRMTGAPGRSAFVAGVFALHPLHVESVAWAAARKDVLSGLFAMLALLAHERVARRGASPARVSALAACLALGLMAKPVLVTLPFALLLLDAWPLARLSDPDTGRPDPQRLRGALLEKLPLFALVAASCVVTVAAQGSGRAIAPLDVLPLGARLGNALVAYVAYLGKALWPSGLVVFYPHPGLVPLWKSAGAAALLAALSAACLLAWRRRPALAVGWLWYLGTLLPVIGLVQIGSQAMADRYTYLPLVGLAVALGFGVPSGGRLGRALAIAGCAVLAALAVATFAQVQRWRDSVALLEHARAHVEPNVIISTNLGQAYANAGRLDEAAAELERVLEMRPTSVLGNGLLGDVRMDQDRLEDAVRLYRRALEPDPASARWNLRLGDALLRQGELEEAVTHLRRALVANPGSAHALGNLGLVLQRLGRLDAAIDSYERALEVDPGLVDVRGNLGVALIDDGQLALATAQLERALAQRPESALLHAHLARALSEDGDLSRALEHADRALSLDPESPELHATRARLLERLGREDEAIAGYRAVLSRGLRPVAVLNNLAWLLSTRPSADPEEAVALAREAARLTRRRQPRVLDTLAAAQAAAGRFDAAARVAQEAAALAARNGDAALVAEIRARRALYLEGRPAE